MYVVEESVSWFFNYEVYQYGSNNNLGIVALVPMCLCASIRSSMV